MLAQNPRMDLMPLRSLLISNITRLENPGLRPQNLLLAVKPDRPHPTAIHQVMIRSITEGLSCLDQATARPRRPRRPRKCLSPSLEWTISSSTVV